MTFKEMLRPVYPCLFIFCLVVRHLFDAVGNGKFIGQVLEFIDRNSVEYSCHFLDILDHVLFNLIAENLPWSLEADIDALHRPILLEQRDESC